MTYSFVLAGGGTGGHVFPALAVARVLRERGHRALFIGTKAGMESRLVPEAGFEIEFIRYRRLQSRRRCGKSCKLLCGFPARIAASRNLLTRLRAAAVFSMGGYVAGPVMLAAITRRMPLVIMEPNAIPGLPTAK